MGAGQGNWEMVKEDRLKAEGSIPEQTYNLQDNERVVVEGKASGRIVFDRDQFSATRTTVDDVDGSKKSQETKDNLGKAAELQEREKREKAEGKFDGGPLDPDTQRRKAEEKNRIANPTPASQFTTQNPSGAKQQQNPAPPEGSSSDGMKSSKDVKNEGQASSTASTPKKE